MKYTTKNPHGLTRNLLIEDMLLKAGDVVWLAGEKSACEWWD